MMTYWVLTAAHCTYGTFGQLREYDMIAVAGNVDYHQGESVQVEEIFRHEGFDESTGNHDVALIKLKTPFSLARKISLPSPHQTTAHGTKVRVSGWGYTSEQATVNGQLPRDLRATEMYTVGEAECRSKVQALAKGKFNQIFDSQICFQNRRQDTNSLQGRLSGLQSCWQTQTSKSASLAGAKTATAQSCQKSQPKWPSMWIGLGTLLLTTVDDVTGL